MIEAQPKVPIGSSAFDSNDLDDDLDGKGIKVVSLHGRNRKKPKSDGRELHRHKRR